MEQPAPRTDWEQALKKSKLIAPELKDTFRELLLRCDNDAQRYGWVRQLEVIAAAERAVRRKRLTVLAAFGLFAAGGFMLVNAAAIGALIEVLRSSWAVTGLFLLVVGAALFWARLKVRAFYGALEVAAGVVVGVMTVHERVSPSDGPMLVQWTCAVLLASAYLVVSGFDSLHVGLFGGGDVFFSSFGAVPKAKEEMMRDLGWLPDR